MPAWVLPNLFTTLHVCRFSFSSGKAQTLSCTRLYHMLLLSNVNALSLILDQVLFISKLWNAYPPLLERSTLCSVCSICIFQEHLEYNPSLRWTLMIIHTDYLFLSHSYLLQLLWLTCFFILFNVTQCRCCEEGITVFLTHYCDSQV